MEGDDQGNSLGRNFCCSCVGQQSTPRYAEGPVGGKWDPAFALTTIETRCLKVSVERNT